MKFYWLFYIFNAADKQQNFVQNQTNLELFEILIVATKMINKRFGLNASKITN
jgi:hypothetical protein